MTDEGSLEEYLGLLIEHEDNGKFRVSQPMLIERIIEAVPSLKDARSSKTPLCPESSSQKTQGVNREKKHGTTGQSSEC